MQAAPQQSPPAVKVPPAMHMLLTEKKCISTVLKQLKEFVFSNLQPPGFKIRKTFGKLLLNFMFTNS
jgi:hypothetical protein